MRIYNSKNSLVIPGSMAEFPPISKGQYLNLFLNISFLFLIFLCLTTHFYSSNSNFLNQFKTFPNAMTAPYHDSDTGCRQLHEYSDREAKCSYVKSHTGCQNGGYISYLRLFYCNFDPVLGYSALILWLLVLFYLLGNTAANYFCCSLEGLSRVLKLSPNIAGVTLLSLGNGAPDLFASIVSFMGDETEKVGLNSILGGAFFVSSIVVGIISISVCHSRPSIERSSFIWDVTFFLLSLACLLVIIMLGKINLWGAISFFSLYFVYVLFISTSHLCHRKEGVGDDSAASGSPILPVTKNFLEYQTEGLCEVEEPLLGFVGDDKPILMEKAGLVQVGDDRKRRRRCLDLQPSTSSHLFVCRLLFFLELPLYLPRRLTIPVITAERWSKPFAVVSVTIAPVLVAVVWNSHGSKPSWLVYLIGASVGTISGVVAFFTTERSNPPTKWLFPWHAGGFLMSITWTYIAADELISLLVSLGLILGISPSILGLTVLAWGNSLGDLVSNVTMALNGGAEGAQVALSGCYAGPIFNTLIGLGLPLAFSAWSEYPASYIIPKDNSDYETLGFLMGGLLWALVILPKRNMMLDRCLGGGLVAIYLCFLSLRIARALVPN